MQPASIEGAVNGLGQAAVLLPMQGQVPARCHVHGRGLSLVLEGGDIAGPWTVASAVSEAALRQRVLLVVETGEGGGVRESVVPVLVPRPRS
jgi:hypothetical protein